VLLEEAALLRAQQKARDGLKRRLLRGRGDAAADTGGSDGGESGSGTGADLLALLAEGLREGGVFASPAGLVSLPGYGLPLEAEREQARDDADGRAARLRALDARLREAGRAWLPRDERAALDQT